MSDGYQPLGVGRTKVHDPVVIRPAVCGRQLNIRDPRLPDQSQRRKEDGDVDPVLIDRITCLVGTPEEIIEQVRQLEQAGLKHLMLLPLFETQYGVIEDFARNVMEKM